MAYADAVKAGVGIDPGGACSPHVYSEWPHRCPYESHSRFRVRTSINRPSDNLLTYRKLHSGFTTSVGMWTDTVIRRYSRPLLGPVRSSHTSAMIFQDESGEKDAVPSFLCDAELDDATIGGALSSPLFIQERGEPAGRRQAHHPDEESLLPAQSFSVCHSSTERPVYEPSSSQKRKSGRDMENERIRILSLKDKKSKFSLESELRSRSTNLKPFLIEEVSRN